MLLTAGKLTGISASFFGKADASQKIARLGLRLLFRYATNGYGCFDDVFKRGQMREQVEALKHHAHFGAALEDFPFLQLIKRIALLTITDQFTVYGDKSVIDALEMVDGAQQCGLAGAGLAENGGDTACRNGKADIIKHLQRPEGFRNAMNIDRPATISELKAHGTGRHRTLGPYGCRGHRFHGFRQGFARQEGAVNRGEQRWRRVAQCTA